MSDLIEYLRGVAENANLPQYMRDRLTEAAAALEAVRRNAGVLVPPEGYALVSVEMLRIWGKLDEVRECCRYLKHATPQPAHVDDEALIDAAIDQSRGKGGGEVG